MRRENIFIKNESQDAVDFLVSRICAQVKEKPTSILGLATGRTMEPVYKGLVKAHQEGLTFAGISSFNLDEYIGIPASHPASYHCTMQNLFFDHVDINQSQCHLPKGETNDYEQQARTYEALIANFGGIDLQILGIGQNGHIGFNEPGSLQESTTRVVDLHADTIRANQSFFAAQTPMPTQAITVGISTILSAKSIAVLAIGAQKKTALKAALNGPVTSNCPASYLQEHDNTIWITDQQI